MYARSIALGILAALDFASPYHAPASFTLESTGAVRLNAAGYDARYGVLPSKVSGRPLLIISVGVTSSQGAVHLVLPIDRLPAPGRYPIGAGSFQASFMAGTAEHPLGWFHGESGSVTIAQADEEHISGTFTIKARGFLGSDVADEDKWVTVQGTFDAEGDSTTATVASVQ